MKKPNARVAERIKKERTRVGVDRPRTGVQPLNPGFFLLERIRAKGAPKARSAVRAQLGNGRDK